MRWSNVGLTLADRLMADLLFYEYCTQQANNKSVEPEKGLK